MSDTSLIIDANQIFIAAFGVILATALIGFYNYVRNRLHCIDVVAEKTKKVDERTVRQSKAMILMAQILDTKNDSKNPTSPLDMAEKVKELLLDERGEL